MRQSKLAILLALAACAPPTPSAPFPAPAAPGPPPGYFAVRTPEAIADFVLVNRQYFEDEAAGVGLRYERPSGLVVDVFVYPGPDLGAKCGLPCASEMLATEVADFQESLPLLIERGNMQAARVSGTRRLVPPAGARWRLGHHIALAVTRDDRPQLSDLYLYYVPRFRVKVRATYEDDRANRDAVAAFTRALMPAIAP